MPEILQSFNRLEVDPFIVDGNWFHKKYLVSAGIGPYSEFELAVIIIAYLIQKFLNFLRIGSYYQQLAKGVIIIGAIMLDMAVSKKNR